MWLPVVRGGRAAHARQLTHGQGAQGKPAPGPQFSYKRKASLEPLTTALETEQQQIKLLSGGCEAGDHCAIYKLKCQ